MQEHWLTRAMNTGFTFGRMAELVSRELSYSGGLSITERMGLWRRGFVTLSAVIYGPDNTESGDYLSDYARFVRTPKINGRFARMLDNKLAFTQMMDEIRPGTAPTLLGTVSRGELSLRNQDRRTDNWTNIEQLLDQERRIVIKPLEGGLGAGVLFLTKEDDGAFQMNGSPATRPEILQRIRQCRADIVTEFIQQGAYARAIQPRTINTIRMLTLRTPDAEVIVPVAVHRFGAESSGAIDAWHRGGVGALVDPNDGSLGEAIGSPLGVGVEWHAHHPETGAPIKGVRVPNWPDVAREITEVARRLPFLPYIGWDIVVTNDGFRVLEGNNRSDLDFLQVHTPLLRDPRVRRFFELHDVIPRSTAGV